MKQETREQIHRLGMEYEANYGGCAQCVLCALRDTVLREEIAPAAIKAATALMAGGVRSGNSCGAFNGALMAIACVMGRDPSHMENKQAVADTVVPCRMLYQKFMDEYGSVLCRDIQYKIMGKSYRMYDPEDMERFLADGGHDDKCTNVVAKAAVWTAEVLEECGVKKFD